MIAETHDDGADGRNDERESRENPPQAGDGQDAPGFKGMNEEPDVLQDGDRDKKGVGVHPVCGLGGWNLTLSGQLDSHVWEVLRPSGHRAMPMVWVKSAEKVCL